MKRIALILFSLFILVIGISCAAAADLNNQSNSDDSVLDASIGVGDVSFDENQTIIVNGPRDQRGAELDNLPIVHLDGPRDQRGAELDNSSAVQLDGKRDPRGADLPVVPVNGPRDPRGIDLQSLGLEDLPIVHSTPALGSGLGGGGEQNFYAALGGGLGGGGDQNFYAALGGGLGGGGNQDFY